MGIRSLEARFGATPSQITVARRAVRDFARAHGLEASLLSDIELAVGEALNNAAEHGNKERGHVLVSCTIDDHRLIIEVQDDGPGFLPENIAAPNSADPALRGFGLYLMRTLMDDVSFADRGRKVRLMKRLPESA